MMNSLVQPAPSDDAMPAGVQGTMPTVIIIMRTKDRPLLLARGLASVLSQHFTDWHLCLVNDGGSPSECNAVVARFHQAFGPRLQVIHHPTSRGMEAASNSAIAATDSTYLVVHDDDDAWHPDFLTETVAFLDNEKNSRFVGVVTWSELVRERVDGQQILPIGRSGYNCWYTSIDFHRLLGGNTIPTMCFLYRRSILERVGLYSETLSVLGDWDFNIRCLLAGDIGVIPRVLAYYHQREAQTQDAYGNSIKTAQQTHDETGALLRNEILRKHLKENPADLGHVAAISRGFVQTIDRLNEIETYLAFRISHAAGSPEQTGSVLSRSTTAAEMQVQLATIEQRLEAIGGELRPLIEIARRLNTLLTPVRVVVRLARAVKRLFVHAGKGM